MRTAIEESNRHRMHQIRYNIANGLMPRQIKRNTQAPNMLISTTEEESPKYPFATGESALIAADTKAEYNNEAENIDLLIKRARENMEQAAKALDFTAAKRYRDQMYHFEKVKQENNLNK